MKRVICILSIIFLALVTASAKIHTIGDSTMADYDQNEPDQKGMYGWGQVFGDYFANGMTVKTGATVARAHVASTRSSGLTPKGNQERRLGTHPIRS